MKDKPLIPLSILVLVLISNFVLAAAPSPSPKCYIKGEIQSVEFKEAYNESCLYSNCMGIIPDVRCCPTDMEYYHPARYFLEIKIEEVSYVSGEAQYKTCEEIYQLNTEQTIFIEKDKVNLGDSFTINLKIEGRVSSFWGKSFDSYSLGLSKEKIVETKENKEWGIYTAIFIIIIAILTIILFRTRYKK